MAPWSRRQRSQSPGDGFARMVSVTGVKFSRGFVCGSGCAWGWGASIGIGVWTIAADSGVGGGVPLSQAVRARAIKAYMTCCVMPY